MFNEESKAQDFRRGYTDENTQLTSDTQKESVPHSFFSSMKKDTDYPNRNEIFFSCKSRQRRNVNRCIASFILTCYNKDDIKEYYAKYDFTLDNGSCEVLKKVKEHERCKGAHKKNYKELFKTLMCYRSLRMIMKCSLEYLDYCLKHNKLPAMKSDNSSVYATTVKNYIDYIDKIESDLKTWTTNFTQLEEDKKNAEDRGMPIEEKKVKRGHEGQTTIEKDLREENKRLKAHLNDIEKINKELNDRIEELTARSKILEAEKKELKGTLEEVRKTLKQLQEENQYLKKLQPPDKE